MAVLMVIISSPETLFEDEPAAEDCRNCVIMISLKRRRISQRPRRPSKKTRNSQET
jgi:hypothetical protein